MADILSLTIGNTNTSSSLSAESLPFCAGISRADSVSVTSATPLADSSHHFVQDARQRIPGGCVEVTEESVLRPLRLVLYRSKIKSQIGAGG